MSLAPQGLKPNGTKGQPYQIVPGWAQAQAVDAGRWYHTPNGRTVIPYAVTAMPSAGLTRREMLKRTVVAGAAVTLPSATFGRGVAATRLATQPPAIPFGTLTEAEGATLEAVVARLIPADAAAPGALEAGAAHYIDRALSGALAASLPAYRAGLAALDRYAEAQRGGRFRALADADQDDLLAALESDAAPGFTPSGLRVLRTASHPHHRRHVLRPGLRWQRELHRLGTARLSGPPNQRSARPAADRSDAAGPTGFRLRLPGICGGSRKENRWRLTAAARRS